MENEQKMNHCGAESSREYMVRYCKVGAGEWTEKYFTFKSDADKFRAACERQGMPTLKVAEVHL